MPVLTNTRHELFCQAIARGISATQSYIDAGYSKNGAAQSALTLLRNPQITSRIEELKLIFTSKSTVREIGIRDNRIAWLDERSRLLRRVIAERAADPEFAKVAGGKTGLLVKTYKQIGAGKDSQLVEEYAVDTAMLKEMRAHEQQAAQELGQWIEKRDEKRTFALDDMPEETLREWVQNAAKGESVQ
jgi:hypothetical protein